ncbi:MAG: HAMP domain-containing sensor histidine kinase [Nitrospirae bacterium]|nr:HAMP domain-containing sensor histidine kinase [Nitrospirota bacterium]
MKLFLKSIKGRLFLWIFIVVSLILITSGVLVYYEVKNVVVSSVDEVLHSDMQIFTGLLHVKRGKVEFEFSDIISGDYTIPLSGHYYKIIINNNVFAASPSLVDNTYDIASGRLESFDQKNKISIYASKGPGNEPIRVMRQDLTMFGIPVTMFAARSMAESFSMLNRLMIFFIFSIPATIIIIGIVSVLIAKRSLSPLDKFSSDISNITHRNLSNRIETLGQSAELQGLSESFNQMLDRLERAFEAEKRIVSDASHELKTPVAVIRSNCDVTLAKERPAGEYIDALQKIRNTSAHMGKIVTDMLLLARLDSGSVAFAEFSPVKLSECANNAVALVNVLAQDRGVEINMSVDEEIWVNGNKEQLTEAFLNMLENAVNYNKANGSVDIHITKAGGKAVLSFADTGSGISKADLSRIFDRFFRSEETRSKAGSGLGLSIAKTIIEAHSGEIKVKSQPGIGSIFTLILPQLPED